MHHLKKAQVATMTKKGPIEAWLLRIMSGQRRVECKDRLFETSIVEMYAQDMKWIANAVEICA